MFKELRRMTGEQRQILFTGIVIGVVLTVAVYEVSKEVRWIVGVATSPQK